MNKYFTFLLVFLTGIAFGQIENKKNDASSFFKIPPVIKETDPEWVKYLYEPNPNIDKITQAYESFYNENILERNNNVRNFEFLQKQIKSGNIFVDKNGFIKETPMEELLKKQDATQKLFNNNKKNSIEEKKTSSSTWQNLGPNNVIDTFIADQVGNGAPRIAAMQANIVTIKSSPSNNNVLFCAGQTGSLFKSTDSGATWASISDNLNAGSFGTIAIHPNNDNFIIVADGNKIYKTTDGGATWTTVHTFSSGAEATGSDIDPSNPDVIFVGNTGTGLFKSTDGGATFTNVFTIPVYDLERHTSNPSILFVGVKNATLNRSEIWKSTDGGLTFTPKTTGWFTPTNATALGEGGMRFDVTKADPNRLMAIVLGNDITNSDDHFIGVYRSDDAGETWYKPLDSNNDNVPDNWPPNSNFTSATANWCVACYEPIIQDLGHQGFYDLAIGISETDADKFMVGGATLYMSTNGGKTYSGYGRSYCPGCVHYQHEDIQDIGTTLNGDFFVTSDGGVDHYSGANMAHLGAKTTGLNATENWGFGQGWNTDILVSGTYHNGNHGWKEGYANKNFRRLGGTEEATGFVNPFRSDEVYFHGAGTVYLSNDLMAPSLVSAPGWPSNPNTDIWYWSLRGSVIRGFDNSKQIIMSSSDKIYKSLDSGKTFTTLYSLNDTSKKILNLAISRQDPNTIYMVYKPNEYWSSSNMKKSTDGGLTFTEVTLPTGAWQIRIEVSQTDKNKIVLSRVHGGTGSKIWTSDNGGTTWTDITAGLNAGEIEDIFIHETPTEDVIYASTSNSVFYKSSASPTWQTFRTGLPATISILKMQPFYRDGKIRISTSRGFWEADLVHATKIIPQPIVENKNVTCTGQVVYFDDYSIVKHQGVSWNWSFPGASTVSSNTARNPEVTYSVPGTYDATLTLTDANNVSYSKTVVGIVTVENDCATRTSSINVYQTANYDYLNDFLNQDISNVTSDSFTISGWFKPTATINYNNKAITSLRYENSNQIIKIQVDSDRQVSFNFNASDYTHKYQTGLYFDLYKWNFFALVITPTKATMYVNDKKYELNNITFTSKTITKLLIGNLPSSEWQIRPVGQFEEFKYYKKALTEEEIKLSRHLLLPNTNDPDLFAYYSFDIVEQNSTTFKNQFTNLKTGEKLQSENLYSSLKPSDAPIGSGISEKQTVTSSVNTVFTSTGVEINFTGTSPNGDIYVTKLNSPPFGIPNTNIVLPSTYWIVNNYGTNSTFGDLSSIKFSNIGVQINNTPSDIKLYKRLSNDFDNATWPSTFQASANSINNSTQTVTFDNPGINSFSQFYIGSQSTLDTDYIEEIFAKRIMPNPISSNSLLKIYGVSTTNGKIIISNLDGKQLFKNNFENNEFLLPDLPIGIYLVTLETKNEIINERLIIK